MVLLRVRWQIELLFKLFKSHTQVDTWQSQKPWRILCEVYAKIGGGFDPTLADSQRVLADSGTQFDQSGANGIETRVTPGGRFCLWADGATD